MSWFSLAAQLIPGHRNSYLPASAMHIRDYINIDIGKRSLTVRRKYLTGDAGDRASTHEFMDAAVRILKG